MSSTIRVLALLVPLLALVAAEGDPAPAPAPEADPVPVVPAVKKAPAVDNSLLNNIDLRLTIGGGGGISEIENEDTDVIADYEDGTGGSFALHLLYLRARPGGVGFAVGGGFFAHSYDGDPEGGGPSVTLEAAGVDVYAAFVYRPTRNWHFELPAVVLSLGSATLDTDGGTESESGGYGRFAAQLGAYYTFDFGLQLGLDIGAGGFGALVEYEGSDDEYSVSGSGAYVNFTIGGRF